MKLNFALVDGNKVAPTKGATGICPCCGSELIAKCGEVRIHHWAHKAEHTCDPWWENQTEWHRSWKNYFPIEWQEISIPDERTGEKHIADVRTSQSVVIEFQHSPINPQERRTRENFYKKMVWVVDGTRSKNCYKRFLKGQHNFRKTSNKGIYMVSFPDECFPSSWLQSSVPVIFDFRGTEPVDDPKDMRNSLYLLFPSGIEGESIVIAMAHEFFIKHTTNGEWLTFMNNISQLHKAWQYQRELRKRQQDNIMFGNFMRAARYRNRRKPL